MTMLVSIYLSAFIAGMNVATCLCCKNKKMIISMHTYLSPLILGMNVASFNLARLAFSSLFLALFNNGLK